uniref:NADH dehydrogenase subunit 1 n=1 Tax=Cellana toreuma TaxID=42758 RepID=UPI00202803DC|nr:NADH dehydrogenase subunit 1 [Cellana toreuma]UPX89407.1 NADH dehydrogenase subunit 1 [Cellana toreuma]
MWMYIPLMTINLICVLITVAFFTLFERKTLSYMQTRKGPNKVSISGIPQPAADAIKLFSKQITKPLLANQIPYFAAPIISLIVALLLWQTLPMNSTLLILSWSSLLFISLSALNVYGTLLAGWSSNSKYALIGALRAVSQTISYEVSLTLILMTSLFCAMSFSFLEVADNMKNMWFFFMMMPMSLIWLASCVAETNRAPFDFAEGESELVSGFNIEYGAAGFAMIFLAEYANIILMSMVTAVIFFGGIHLFILSSSLILSVKIIFFCFSFIWFRATYPRFRYDRLMYLTWKGFLPFTLAFLMLILIIQMNMFL